MISSGPLSGRCIVVTRPLAQAGPLADAIAAAGGRPLIFPLLEIFPAPDPRPLVEAVERIADYSLAIFVSPNAVAYALPAILARGPWPMHLQAAAVGPGTVKALALHAVENCLLPSERFDSEGLLALPALAAELMKGIRVAIFRGDGGRELLADTLRERGATVDCITCYQRTGPTGGAEVLLAAWRAGQLDALTVSSSEGLRYLVDLLDAEGRAFLQATPVFVPHARIAEIARSLGLQQVVLTEAADRGILEGLKGYCWLS